MVPHLGRDLQPIQRNGRASTVDSELESSRSLSRRRKSWNRRKKVTPASASRPPTVPRVIPGELGLSVPSGKCVSSFRARAPVLWERLPSKKVTVGPYSPRWIGISPTVPAVLTCYLQSSLMFCRLHRLLQPSPVTCRAVNHSLGPPVIPSYPANYTT